MADGIHTADETVELGDHCLKGLSFDWYNFHIAFFLIVTVSFATKKYIIRCHAMDFQKVAACCADMAVIVQSTAFRLSVGKPVEYDLRSAFNSHVL